MQKLVTWIVLITTDYLITVTVTLSILMMCLLCSKQTSPVKQEYSVEYLRNLSKCCQRSRLYYQQSTPTENDTGSTKWGKWKNDNGSTKWGKWIDLVCVEPKARHHTGSKVQSKATGVSAMVAVDRVEELPDCGSSNSQTDCNHNLVVKTKKLLLPATSTLSASSVQKNQLRFADVDDLSATHSDAGGDADVDMQTAIGYNNPHSKKQAVSKAKAKNSTASGLSAKSKPGRRQPATRKKQPVGAENKRPRNSRKAKNDANSQMKLQFADESMFGKSNYEDTFEDDAYVFQSADSPEHKATTSYRESKRQDKQKTAGDLPPLAQRIMSSMTYGHAPKSSTSFTAASFLPFRSSSDRSSSLFDAMLQQQSQPMPREQNIQSRNISGTEHRRSFRLTNATTEDEPESVPRYY